MTAWGNWSVCSHVCGGRGTRYRVRSVAETTLFWGKPCPPSVQTANCTGDAELAPCSARCIAALGSSTSTVVVASGEDGLQSPRDLAFSPHPGRHLGSHAQGRHFPTQGEEVWVANGNGHSVSIISGIGTDWVAALTRKDRGYYHYMHNITGISFNSVSPDKSKRSSEKDTYGFVATCQYSNNTYLGLKDPNYFQGPTLYDTNPKYKNLVARDGSPCTPGDECFLLHVDMLHESPTCSGIVHDPELLTHYGTVYWAIDGWRGHLVRYDFQQPHGAGFMDHSVASVRRYPEVKISVNGLHQGMVVDASHRRLYISDPGKGQIIFVNIDTGKYARTAREEYPPFSSRLPSFEYSIYECVEHGVFAAQLDVPSGLALDSSLTHLFVAEYKLAQIIVFDLATGHQVQTIDLGRSHGLSGIAFSPSGQGLFAVDADAHQLIRIQKKEDCNTTQDNMSPILNPSYTPAPADPFASSSEAVCEVVETIPNSTLFDQVHVVRTGYGDDNIAVQNDSMVDPSAALLQSRTDCHENSSLNYDALLLGGYFCHTCLPDSCNNGGVCANVQWLGYTCDNEFFLTRSAATNWEYALELAPNHPNKSSFNPRDLILELGRAYDFIINSPNASIIFQDSSGNTVGGPIDEGRLTIHVDGQTPEIGLIGTNLGWRMDLKLETTTTTTTTTTTSTSTTTTTTTTSTTSTTSTTTSTTSTTTTTISTIEAVGSASGGPSRGAAAILILLAWSACNFVSK